jgi:Na+/H+ antiporter NhaD/arsenite permease-like protein
MSPIQLMMPLSFAAIIGGCVTIIGAPVNLLIISLAKDQDPLSVSVLRCARAAAAWFVGFTTSFGAWKYWAMSPEQRLSRA